MIPTPRSGGGWWLAALASGVLLACAFPSIGWEEIAWVALVPLLVSCQDRPFRAGLLAGLAFYLPTLAWLNIVMTRYGGLPLPSAVAAHVLLSLYLAGYFGAACWLTERLQRRLGWWPGLTLPLSWVALDYLRNYLLTGFPWAAIGYSQAERLTLIQSTDLTGIYGLTFLVVLGNAAVAGVVLAWRDGRWRRALAPLALFVLLFGLNLGYGLWRLPQFDAPPAQPVRVALIQGNIDQSVKWNPDQQQRTVDTYVRLSRQAAAAGPLDLIVWPESATPFFFQQSSELSAQVAAVPRFTGAELLFGSPAYQRHGDKITYLNSAFLLSARGEYLGRSDKVHLVPFGEYVPLRHLLFFIDKLVVGIGDFAPGRVEPLPMDGHALGVLVCYEGIFPGLARGFVAKGAKLLVNITNDAWFGRSAAPWQHLDMARLRAVENRVWLVRAANTGVSAIVDPAGRVTQRSNLFETSWIRGTAGFGGGSFYTRHGDWLPQAAALLVLFGLARALISRRR